MQEVLQQFAEITGFKGVIVYGSDGLIIEQNWSDSAELDFLAANLADLVTLVNQILRERLQQEEFDFLTIDMKSSRLFIKQLNPFTFIAVFVDNKAKLGLTLLELKNKIKKLQEVI